MKPLHEKTISEVFSPKDVPTPRGEFIVNTVFVTGLRDDLKQWAIAIVKEIRIHYQRLCSCKDIKNSSRKTPIDRYDYDRHELFGLKMTATHLVSIELFLMKAFELTEEDLK